MDYRQSPSFRTDAGSRRSRQVFGLKLRVKEFIRKREFNGDFMGISWHLVGNSWEIHGNFMGISGDQWDLMGYNGDLMENSRGIMRFYNQH